MYGTLSIVYSYVHNQQLVINNTVKSKKEKKTQ